MSSASQFSIRLMREEDRNEILSLLINSFFQDEPLAKCLELGEPIDFARNIVDDALHDQCSFVAYDVQSNQVVGVCLNEMKFAHDAHTIDETNEKVSFILRFLHDMHQNKNYRGYGLGSQLIVASIEHARKMSIKGVYAETTNMHSFNCFIQQNFQIYHQVNYSDYDQIRLATLTNSQCQLVARTV